jgi:hypothetical protein
MLVRKEGHMCIDFFAVYPHSMSESLMAVATCALLVWMLNHKK